MSGAREDPRASFLLCCIYPVFFHFLHLFFLIMFMPKIGSLVPIMYFASHVARVCVCLWCDSLKWHLLHVCIHNRYLGTRSENLGQRHAIGWDMGFGGGGIVLSGWNLKKK